jgi:hypothetical protein
MSFCLNFCYLRKKDFWSKSSRHSRRRCRTSIENVEIIETDWAVANFAESIRDVHNKETAIRITEASLMEEMHSAVGRPAEFSSLAKDVSIFLWFCNVGVLMLWNISRANLLLRLFVPVDQAVTRRM